MTILLYIAIGIGCALLCTALWVINRQARALARKQQELKLQKFANKQARIVEEIANRIKTSAASERQQPPAPQSAPHQPVSPQLANTPHASPAANLPKLAEAAEQKTPPAPASKIQADNPAPLAPQKVSLKSEPLQNPGFTAPQGPEAGAPPPKPAMPSLTDILKAANGDNNETANEQPNHQNNLKQPPPPAAEKSTNTAVIKAGRGLPPLVKPAAPQQPPLYAQRGEAPARDEASNAHIKWQPARGPQPITPAKGTPTGVAPNIEPNLNTSQKGSLKRSPLLNGSEKRGTPVNGNFTPDPDESLYEQISAYAKWVAGQSDIFTLEREKKGQETDYIPLLFDEEALGRRNGHWFGLFTPVELEPLLQELKHHESRIYCSFDSAAVEALRRPGEEILRLAEEEQSSRYQQVIKESALPEFLIFLDELKSMATEG